MNAPEKLPRRRKAASAPSSVDTPPAASGIGRDDNTLRFDLAWLSPSPTNPRKTFTGLEELAASIAALGVLQPLLVRPWPFSRPWPHDTTAPSCRGYEIVAGERRYRAAVLDAIDKGTFDYATTFPDSKRAPKLTAVPGRAITVTSYLGAWLDRRRPNLKASTFGGYLKVVNGHLIPGFGRQPLADIKRIDIKTWAAGLSAGNKAIANIFSVFRAALQEAFEDELIESNPLAGWVYRKTEPPRETDDVDPFTPEEQAAILARLDGQGWALIQFAFWTGLRTSELVALTWSDVDWRRGVVQIRRAQTQAARKTGPETTKTRAGLREIKLLPPALDALTQQKTWTFLKGEEVFQNPRTGERWTGDQPIRKTLWTHALKRAEVRYRNPYQTRHTYASMMLSAGEHPMWVAQQMGHADWGMIRRIYGKWIPDSDTQAGSRAVAMFGPEMLTRKLTKPPKTAPNSGQ